MMRLAATLKEDAQKKVKAINAEEALIKENCDAILAPLDAYKQIERDRVAGHESALQELHGAAYVQPGSSTETIKATLNAFQNRPSREWQEYIWRAREVVQSGIRHIQECLAFSEKQEAEAAELARLREAEAERRRVADEAAAKAKADAERAANVAHKSKVMGAAKTAIMAIGISEDAARDLVNAIVSSSIPHVRMEF